MITCEYCRSKFVECKSRPGTCSRCGAPEPKVTEVFEWSDYCRVPIYATASGIMFGDPGLIFPSGIALVDE